jgi:hypothetical protein
MAGRDRCSSRLAGRSLTTRGLTPAMLLQGARPAADASVQNDRAGYEVELAQVIVHQDRGPGCELDTWMHD